MGIDCTYFKHLKLKSLFLKHPVSGDQQFKKQKFAPPQDLSWIVTSFGSLSH